MIMKGTKHLRKEFVNKKKTGLPPQNNKWWLPLLGIIPLTFILFAPGIGNGFTNWDDPTYILDNPLIREFSITNIKKIFTEVYFANYQPLHIFSYAIEYQFFKDNAAGYHVISILMHLVCTVLVSWLAWLITRDGLVPAIAALFFGIHPMHMESIAWAAERKDMLYAMFFFLSLIWYVKYIQSGEKRLYLIYAFLFFTLSIFSKTMAACLVPMLILFDFFYRRKISTGVIVEKIPFFLVAFVMGIVAVLSAKESGSIDTNESFSFLERMLFACNNLFMYFFKLVIPINLSAYYPYPEKTGGLLPWNYYVSPVFVIALVAGCIYSLKHTRYIFLLIGFFVISIFLVLQLLPVGPAIFSERYSYIPSAGFFMLLALGLSRIMENKRPFLKSMKNAMIAVTGVWCMWLCVVTWQRNAVWKDSIALWNDVISQFDKALHAYNNRADAFYKTGNYEGAIRDLSMAISLNERYALAWYNRGNAYGQLGKFNEAWNDLNRALQLEPDNADALNKRGQANAVLGNRDDAFSDFNRAASLDPTNPEIHYNIGITWVNSGNTAEACKSLSRAVGMHYQPAIKAFNDLCK